MIIEKPDTFRALRTLAMESVLYGHPERIMPFRVRGFRLVDERGDILHETTDNHQGHVRMDLSAPCETASSGWK
ncbi:MAG: hypothetical protein RRC34_01250 [Lentisphaeria bacterium]|nr:hypothetical protein [Lentisphaeria bacterium]